MRSGRLIRGSVANLEFFIVFVLIFGILSVPIAIVTLVIVLTRGHLTRFSLTDGHRSGFRPGPTERGTMNLIYVCMSTIFACVYVSLHVDIPNPSNAADFRASLDRSKMRLPGFVKRFMAWAYRITEKATVRRVLFMLFNIVAPELVVLVSILELISATDAKRFMRSRGQKGWTTMLAFFADMGGFELEDGTHFRNGREFLEWFDSYYREHGEHVQVDVVKLQEEIDDRSKKDAVIKVVTLLQSTWLFVETMARFIENHAVSELEVTTCAYIFCTLITYVCWLKKPYSVTSHVVLRSGLLHHEKHEGDVAIPRQRPSLRKPEPSYSEASSSRLPSYAEPGSPDLSKEYAPVPILDQAANQLSPSASPKLPRMIYQNARFTPFNRSYQHPDLAWLGTHMNIMLFWLPIDTCFNCSCMPRCWRRRRARRGHPRRAAVERSVHQHDRADPLAHLLHRTDSPPPQRRFHRVDRAMVHGLPAGRDGPAHVVGLLCVAHHALRAGVPVVLESPG